MNDMSGVIVPKSDQINADDLITGPMDITIRDVQIRGGQEQPVSILFEGSDKAFRPCKSMSRVLVQGWGADASKYVGRSLRLYRDPTVKWAGMEVGGIRISHMSHIDGEKLMMLTATKGSRKPHKVFPLKVEQQGQTDDAAAWAEKFITAIGRAPDIEKLNLYLGKVKGNLVALETERPELFAKCDAAITERKQALEPQSDDAEDDPFADDTPDPQTAKLANIRASIAAAMNLKGLAAVDAEWVKHRAVYDDDVAAEIDGLLNARRGELS